MFGTKLPGQYTINKQISHICHINKRQGKISHIISSLFLISLHHHIWYYYKSVACLNLSFRIPRLNSVRFINISPRQHWALILGTYIQPDVTCIALWILTTYHSVYVWEYDCYKPLCRFECSLICVHIYFIRLYSVIYISFSVLNECMFMGMYVHKDVSFWQCRKRRVKYVQEILTKNVKTVKLLRELNL